MKSQPAQSTYVSCKDKVQVAAFLGTSYTLDITADLASMESSMLRDHTNEKISGAQTTCLSVQTFKGESKEQPMKKSDLYSTCDVLVKTGGVRKSSKKPQHKVMKKRIQHMKRQLAGGMDVHVLAVV